MLTPSTNSMMSAMVESLVIHPSRSVTMSIQMSQRRSLGCSAWSHDTREERRRRDAASFSIMVED